MPSLYNVARARTSVEGFVKLFAHVFHAFSLRPS